MHHGDGRGEQNVTDDAAANGGDDTDKNCRNCWEALSERSGNSDGSEETNGERIRHSDYPVEPTNESREQHAEKGKQHGDAEIPIGTQGNKRSLQEQITQESPAESRRGADHGHSEQVELAIAELRGEHRTLQAAYSNGRHVYPRRNFDCKWIHESILTTGPHFGLPEVSPGAGQNCIDKMVDMTGSWSSRLRSSDLLGVNLVHPWIYPWFAASALGLGIPGTTHRPVETWLATAVGVAFTLGVSLALWMTFKSRSRSVKSAITIGVSVCLGIVIAALVTEELNPVSSFFETSTTQHHVPISTQMFLTLCLIFVWLMLWVLLAVLVSSYRSFRRDREALRQTSDRIRLAALNLETGTPEMFAHFANDLAKAFRTQALRIQNAVSESSRISSALVHDEIDYILERVTAPAIRTISELKVTDVQGLRARKERKVSLENVAFRWNGSYFSGNVGALVMGIVALSASANVSFTNPGFLIQIPLIVVAFFVSVSASLILFFAAALTPFLGTNSPAPENIALFMVIFALALLSFIQRANEVRQVRILERLSIANTDLAIEAVRSRQQILQLQKNFVSIIHGKVQSALIAMSVKIEKSPSVKKADVLRIAEILDTAAKELGNDTSVAEPPADFSRAISEVIAIWDGSLNVQVSVTPEAEDFLNRDKPAMSTVLEVISEGTLNASKHAKTAEVNAAVSLEGSRVSVRVSNLSSAISDKTLISTHQGLKFLRQLTSEIHLEVGKKTTTLVAEIPVRGVHPRQ